MVRDANEDPEFIERFVKKLRTYRKPEFSTSRFLFAIMVAYLWGQLVMIAIPQENFGGIDWSYLHWFIPLGAALGVWMVGNVGREMGNLLPCLVAAYVTYPLRYFVYDETYWMTAMIIASAMVFDHYSKEWRRDPPKRNTLKKRCLYLTTAIMIYAALWGSFFYFNGKITDSEGDEVPVHEAIGHVFNSPWWTDLKQTFSDTWQYAQHHGWYETWKQIIDTMDADGEQNAFKVSPFATSLLANMQSNLVIRFSGAGYYAYGFTNRNNIRLASSIEGVSSRQSERGVKKTRGPRSFYGSSTGLRDHQQNQEQTTFQKQEVLRGSLNGFTLTALPQYTILNLIQRNF